MQFYFMFFNSVLDYATSFVCLVVGLMGDLTKVT